MRKIKTKNFLKDLQEDSARDDEGRALALTIIAKTLAHKQLHVIQSTEELEALSQTMQARSDHIAQIRQRLDLALRSNIANDTVH